MSYLPPLNDYFSEQQTKEGLKAVYEAHLKQINFFRIEQVTHLIFYKQM